MLISQDQKSGTCDHLGSFGLIGDKSLDGLTVGAGSRQRWPQ